MTIQPGDWVRFIRDDRCVIGVVLYNKFLKRGWGSGDKKRDVTLDDADYRYTDCNGEQYGFREDSLAYARTVRKLKERFDHLHPADSIGEVGAAVGPCILGLALTAARKRYAPGNGVDSAPGKGVLCHFSNDEGERAAMLLRYVEKDGSR